MTAVDTLTPVDPAGLTARLTALAVTAQRLLGTDSCAVALTGRWYRRCLAGTPGVPTGVSLRAVTWCERVLSGHPDVPVFVTRDALREPAVPASDGPAVRYFAGTTLTGVDGAVIGTLCAWSSRPAADDLDAVPVLLHLRTVARDILTALPQLAVPVSPDDVDRLCLADPTPPATPGVRAGRSDGYRVDIRDVLAHGAVRTVFQPVVHLDGGGVVGFEALTRGPRGSDLETPAALLAAARRECLLGELDWLCRASALRAALDAGLHPGLTWFVNVEPAGLSTPCPAAFEPVLIEAERLRVVWEIVEREVGTHMLEIGRMTEQVRNRGWGVALDDVGVRSEALLALPVVQPDVVKLDMSLLQGLPDAAAASVAAAVRAYAQTRGAVILAEGIGTDEQEVLARVLGATYGQGFRFGLPGPLPGLVPAPRHPVPLPPACAGGAQVTPYDIVTARLSPQRATMRHLEHIERHLRQEAAHSPLAALMMVNPTPADPRPGTAARPSHKRPGMTVIASVDTPTRCPGPWFGTTLAADDRMASEWVVVVLDGLQAAAFVARDSGEISTEGDRRFDFVVTYDRDTVAAVARCIVRTVCTYPSGAVSGRGRTR